MKKIALFITAFMLATLLCACQGENNVETSATTTERQETEVYFVAKVVEPGEETLLVEITEAENSNISLGSQAWISSPKESNVSYSGYAAGDYVRICFDGMVMETYPLQINSVTYISLTDSTGKEISERTTEKTVVNIIDKTVNSDLMTADALEGFYNDDMYNYYFSSIRGKYVIVEYSDGSTETVAYALAENRITIADLDAYGIGYYKEPRNIENIIDHAERDGIPTDQAIEHFYMDETYAYTFPSIRSEHVIVYYKDGTSQPIKEALAEGKLKIEDLNHFGINYSFSPRGYLE